MKKFVDVLLPGHFYHIYNRACGDEKIFVEERNYRFFMDLFEERMFEYVDLICYCLIPNHFHFLVRIKSNQGNDASEINYARKFGNFLPLMPNHSIIYIIEEEIYFLRIFVES